MLFRCLNYDIAALQVNSGALGILGYRKLRPLSHLYKRTVGEADNSACLFSRANALAFLEQVAHRYGAALYIGDAIDRPVYSLHAGMNRIRCESLYQRERDKTETDNEKGG